MRKQRHREVKSFAQVHMTNRASQMVLVVKNLPANAGDIESWVQSLGQEDPLEEGMVTHSILAWRIPCNLMGYSP